MVDAAGFVSQKSWVKHWAGAWSMLSSSYFGDQYTRSIENALGTRLHHAVFVHHEGIGAAFLAQDELNEFGQALARKVVEDQEVGLQWRTLLKKRADEITGLIESMKTKLVGEREWKKFADATYAYIGPHIAVKKVVDYLPAELLKKMLPSFEEARVHAEKVYSLTEEFTREFAGQLAGKTGVEKELLLCLLKEELNEYFANSQLPPTEELRERFKNNALLFEDGVSANYSGSEALAIENSCSTLKGETKILKGMTAFPGKASGIARIVLNPAEPGEFNEGDVLVTGMTRPEYLPLVKKCSAFVTDAGGMLSHAAITARELRKPCVVGTLNATKTIKGGSRVEVDAGKGVVKVI